MTWATLLPILIPALTYVIGHYTGKFVLPAKKDAPLPTTFGHGELLSWLLGQILAAQRSQPSPAPVPAPAPPAGPSGLTDLLQLLQQLLPLLLAQQQKLAHPA